MPDDAIFRALAEGYPMHMTWVVSLGNMWDDIEKTLGHPVRFMNEEPS